MTATQAPTPGPLSVLAFHCESARLVPLLRKEAERLGKGVPTDLPGLHKDIWTAAEIIEQAEEAFAFTQKMDALAPTAPVEASGSERDGYVTAFYEIADMLGIGAQAKSPAEVWTQNMRPQLQAALRPQPSGEMREAVARIVADHVAGGFDAALQDKQEWKDRSGLGYDCEPSDVNGPFKDDYLDAADAILAALSTPPARAEAQDEQPDITPYTEDLKGLKAAMQAEAQDEGAAGEPVACPKCGFFSGDDWKQCDGVCPMPGSPHPSPTPAADDDRGRIAVEALEKIENGTYRRGDHRKIAEKALAALKSTAAKEGGE